MERGWATRGELEATVSRVDVLEMCEMLDAIEENEAAAAEEARRPR